MLSNSNQHTAVKTENLVAADYLQSEIWTQTKSLTGSDYIKETWHPLLAASFCLVVSMLDTCLLLSLYVSLKVYMLAFARTKCHSY